MHRQWYKSWVVAASSVFGNTAEMLEIENRTPQKKTRKINNGILTTALCILAPW